MRVKGFPAFEARRGTVRGRTWWGRAWTQAMEDTSLDQGRLSRGRTYARAGRVGSITVSPGRIAADVTGTADEPYQTEVHVEQLSDREWERFLDEVARRAGHIAALLDRDMPHDLVRAAADAGVRLLPTVGDLEPECSCLDWGYPCKHAAALCYQAAWLLDEDPFVLLLMRGRGESELLEELQRRNARAASPDAGTAPTSAGPARAGRTAGTPALEAFQRQSPPLPDPPLLPHRPLPDALVALPGDPGVDPAGLRLLAANAVARAHDLARAPQPASGAASLTRWEDLVRIAATWPETRDRLRRAAPAGDLDRAVAAWQHGGPAGLAVLEEEWTPSERDLARGRAALAAGWEGEDLPAVREEANRWTAVGRKVQLRYGRDGRWHPYRRESGDWHPAGAPDRDPAAVLADLLAE